MRSAFLRGLAAAATAAVCWLGARSPAYAGDCRVRSDLSTCIDSDNLWPRAGAGPFFALGSNTTTPGDRVSFGLVLSYLSRPIGFTVVSPDPKGSTIYAVDNVLDATVLFAVGMTDRLELSVAAPVALYQDGAGIGAVTGSTEPLVRSAVRDLRFGAALEIVRRSRVGEQRGPALTGRVDFGVPIGTRSAFTSAPTMVAAPSLGFDYRLARFDFAAEIGARIRGQSKLVNAVVGSQLSAGLGASFDVLQKGFLTVGAEAFALYGLPKQGPSSSDPGSPNGPALVPAEWILSVTSAPFMAGDVSFSLGGGGPIPFGKTGALTAPRFRFDAAIRYAPTGRDFDGDGVLDRDDRCPNQPEDRDGFQDADGCPEPDNDNDGILDKLDKCRDAAEDFDGFQDADGCPDLDDDKDGVLDVDDKCRNKAEDKDNFEDGDGCPDPDNDHDGIPDERDRCPNGAEDFDGYQDTDGCPDPDNDGDQIPDEVDQCPLAAEDVDGFEDADGCPDPDNDQDGVLDRQDKCPNAAETLNGVEDDDGCPEQGAKSLVRWDGDRVAAEGLGRFTAGKAELPKPLAAQVRMMAQLARSRMPLGSVVIEAYGDRQGERVVKALEIAAARAAAVKAIFVELGVPAGVITAAAGDPMAKRPTGAPSIEVTARRAPKTIEKKKQ